MAQLDTVRHLFEAYPVPMAATTTLGLYVAARMAGWKGLHGFRTPLVTDKVPKEAAPMHTRPGRTGILLVNLGTPEELSNRGLRKFLREFLMDERVIDLPFYSRWMLVNCIIAPFRSPSSRRKYANIWEKGETGSIGSPIMRHSLDLVKKVQKALDSDTPGKYVVELAMRYQELSIESRLLELKRQAVDSIIIIPLFPQYASSTTGSVHAKVFDTLKTWDRIPSLSFVSNFVEHPGFIAGFVENAKEVMRGEYDHFLFSFHGIPVRHIVKGDYCGTCKMDDGCCSTYNEKNRLCYRAQCYETARRIASSLSLPQDKYTVTFQSRLGSEKWLGPYTDEFVKSLPSQGKKRILVFSAAFVADCLETLDEIGNELEEDFLSSGGEHVQLVPSLNSKPIFVKTMVDMVKKYDVLSGPFHPAK